MPEVTPTSPVPSVAPRWPTLLTLGAAVLAAHLLLLAGGLPDFGATAATVSSPTPTAPANRDAMSGPAQAQQVNAPAPISTVRWIVPIPAPALAPEPAVRQAAAPKPATTARKPAARPAPLAQVEPVPATVASPSPPAAEAPAPAPDLPDATILAQAAAVEPEPTAPASPAASGPAAGPSLPPAQPPASTRLQYVVTGQAKGFHYNATGTLDWELTGERYSARMEMRMPLLGSRVQTSTGGVGAAGLMPERFADKGRSERAAHFEREHQRIRFSANTPEAELLPGAQDRLSLFLQLAGLLQARPEAFASGQVIDMQVAGTGDAEIWRFEVGEESTLTLPAGDIRVRHVVRQPRKEFDSTVEMWLAPELHHLPVRLKVTQANGDMADQQLSQKP